MTTIDWSAPVPRGYWRNARGDLVHERNISDTDRDMDTTARKIHGFGAALSVQMWRFRAHTLDDIYAFVDRVVERYGGKIGGKKGNLQLTTFDGLLQVRLSQADLVVVGPEVEAAQALIEECIEEWAVRSNLNLRALVTQAFTPDASTGKVSVTQLLKLRRIEIDDARWRRAQDAISDAMRPGGTAEYVRLYERATPEERFRQVPLHLACVTRPLEPAFETATAVLERRVRSAVEEARRCGMTEGSIMDALRAAKRREANVDHDPHLAEGET